MTHANEVATASERQRLEGWAAGLRSAVAAAEAAAHAAAEAEVKAEAEKAAAERKKKKGSDSGNSDDDGPSQSPRRHGFIPPPRKSQKAAAKALKVLARKANDKESGAGDESRSVGSSSEDEAIEGTLKSLPLPRGTLNYMNHSGFKLRSAYGHGWATRKVRRVALP